MANSYFYDLVICEVVRGAGEMMEWSEMQVRMDRRLRGRTCRFGGDCGQGLNCPFAHSDEELSIFEAERQLKQRKLMVRCGFCVRGECRYGESCWRGPGDCVPCAPDSEYDTAESASEEDSAGGLRGRSVGVTGAGELVPDQVVAHKEDWEVARPGGRNFTGVEPDMVCGQGRFAALAEEE